MAVVSYQMAMSDGFESTRPAAESAVSSSEYLGIGWNDSSWDLQRGLEVVEVLSMDAWPPELAVAHPQNAA